MKHVAEKGTPISADVVKAGNIGEDYSTEQQEIDGYTFKEVQGSVTGKFREQAQTMTHVYTKNNVTPSPKMDDNSDTLESSKNNDSKTDSTSEKKNTLPQTGDNEGISIIGIISGLFVNNSYGYLRM